MNRNTSTPQAIRLGSAAASWLAAMQQALACNRSQAVRAALSYGRHQNHWHPQDIEREGDWTIFSDDLIQNRANGIVYYIDCDWRGYYEIDYGRHRLDAAEPTGDVMDVKHDPVEFSVRLDDADWDAINDVRLDMTWVAPWTVPSLTDVLTYSLLAAMLAITYPQAHNLTPLSEYMRTPRKDVINA